MPVWAIELVSGKCIMSNGEIMISRETRRISEKAWSSATAYTVKSPTVKAAAYCLRHDTDDVMLYVSNNYS